MTAVLRGVKIIGGPHDGMEVALDPLEWPDSWPVTITLKTENGEADYVGSNVLPSQDHGGTVILSRIYVFDGYRMNVPLELLR